MSAIADFPLLVHPSKQNVPLDESGLGDQVLEFFFRDIVIVDLARKKHNGSVLVADSFNLQRSEYRLTPSCSPGLGLRVV